MKAVLLNPRAGGGRAGRKARLLLEKNPLPPGTALAVPESLEALKKTLGELAAQGLERLVVVGGDGTFHRVVNALEDLGALSRVTLGLVPAGTGSDLARVLALPRRLGEALEVALYAPPVRLDAGELRSSWRRVLFANVASFGISGLVDARVNANPRRGAWAFLAATLAAAREYRPVPCRVVADGEEVFVGEPLVVACANGQSFGKGMRIAPHAVLDDGFFDVVAVRHVGWWKLVGKLPRVYLGRHLSLPQVTWRRAREIKLEPLAASPPFDVDGECYPSGPATFSVLPGKLAVAAPRALSLNILAREDGVSPVSAPKAWLRTFA
ncbi:MAG: diacylglycerol/lipid kinase family protein [Thermoanaerobaculum sp.]